MLSVGDFDGPRGSSSTGTGLNNNEGGSKMVVSIENCDQKEYSIVNIECKDRRRLMFDTICTLTDMQYVIFHASVSSDHDGRAFQVSWNKNIQIIYNYAAICFLNELINHKYLIVATGILH